MHKTPEITRLIHENLWTVLSFAYAQPIVGAVLDKKFKGEFKYLRKTIYETAEVRADRALLEMATQLRVLDDEQDINEFLKQTKHPPLGLVVQADGTHTDLHFRDMTNKVLHGSRFEWALDPDDPQVIIHSDKPERWQHAQLNLTALIFLISGLMV